MLFAKRGHNELFNNPIKLLLYPFLQIILVSQREQLFSSTSPVSKYSSTLSREKKYSLYHDINNTRQISDPFPISDERKSKSLHHRHPSLPKKKKKKKPHNSLDKTCLPCVSSLIHPLSLSLSPVPNSPLRKTSIFAEPTDTENLTSPRHWPPPPPPINTLS